jgi:phage terminase small subunit
MASDKLTIKQEKFAQNLFKGMSQREAYINAYNTQNMADKTIDEEACRLANDYKITARIDELTEELKYRNMVTVEKVLSELASIGFANATDFVTVEEKEFVEGYEKNANGEEDKTRPIIKHYKGLNIAETANVDKGKIKALASIKQGQSGIEIKLHDKVKALELMGKTLGIFIDKVETTNKTEPLSAADKKKFIEDNKDLLKEILSEK